MRYIPRIVKKALMEKIEGGSEDNVFPKKKDLFNHFEFGIFRLFSAIMVVFFLIAAIFLREDDNSCVWIPTFSIPAFLSAIVVVKP